VGTEGWKSSVNQRFAERSLAEAFYRHTDTQGGVGLPTNSSKYSSRVRQANEPPFLETRIGIGIYCDQPAKVLCVESQGDPRRAVHPSNLAMLSIISPQTSTKLVGSCGTAVDHVLAMAFDDPWMDDDLRRVLNAHEVVLDGEWPDVW
jgi:hypothetical protein